MRRSPFYIFPLLIFDVCNDIILMYIGEILHIEGGQAYVQHLYQNHQRNYSDNRISC